MSANTGRMRQWGGRAILGLGLVGVAVVFVVVSYASEAYFSRTAIGRVVAVGEATRTHKNRPYQVAVVTVEYATAAGTERSISRDWHEKAPPAVGSDVTVWYSPYSRRTGRLTPEPDLGMPPYILDGLLVVLSSIAVLFAWGAWRVACGMPAFVRELFGDVRFMRDAAREAKGQKTD